MSGEEKRRLVEGAYRVLASLALFAAIHDRMPYYDRMALTFALLFSLTAISKAVSK